MLNGLSAHYELGDPLLPLAWSWPFFCAQWARMTDVLAKRKVREQRRDERHRDTAMQVELERRLAASGGVD